MVLALAAVGYGVWNAQGPAPRVDGTAEGERLLQAGELRDAAEAGDAIVKGEPTLDGYLFAARVQRALHDRAATERLLGEAYTLAPERFPSLALLVDHRLRGPDDAAKAIDALVFLDGHIARYPQDHNAVEEARLVAFAYLLGQTKLSDAARAEYRGRAQASLAAFRFAGVGTTEQHYNRAQVLVALGDVDGGLAAGRAGIAAGTDKWVALVLHWALATALLHRGEADAAWAEMEAIQADLATWPGTHFGMGKPLVELMQLTAAVRFGRTLAPPADYAARLTRLEDEGVRLQHGDAETRDLVTALLAARATGDTPGALARTDDLLAILGRDRGCEMENQLIRPHTRAMVLVARGELLAGSGDAAGANAAYTEAAALFPADAWLAAKVSATAALTP
ncbi:MAG: hypothetical protein V4850_35435 [Myxococcota bacterium]